jgi:hypothetical protein
MTFMNEIRFQMTRLIGLSYLGGANVALLSYLVYLRRLRWYVCLPLTVATFFVS